jgi:hypothetical protein
LQTVAASVPTSDLLQALVGKIKSFRLQGLIYSHEKGRGYIDGMDLLNEVLSQIVDDYDISAQNVTVYVDTTALREYMEDSGVTSDIEETFRRDAVDVLNGMRNSFGIRIDPLNFIRES